MDDYSSIVLKSEDVLILLTKLQNIGWSTIREASINRIIYLSAVLFSFIYSDKQNIFEGDYIFSRSIRGPEDAGIEKALIHLDSNDLIIHTDRGYSINSKNYTYSLSENYKIKEPWFRDIVYILGIYGEDKIFDFIFHDPEYKKSFERNSVYRLDIGVSNDTVKYINEFKGAFEQKIGDIKEKLPDRDYLKFYFEFIFGEILRGEK